METVMIPKMFPATMPAYAQNQGGGWRPAAHAQLRAYPIARPAEQHWRPNPIQLGQIQQTPAASFAKGADVLFSMLTAVGAMTVGIAAMTIGIGGEKASIPGGQGKQPSPTWKWLGGITAALGLLTVLSNVSKISKISEVVTPVTRAQ
jgi:hypothetical protein